MQWLNLSLMHREAGHGWAHTDFKCSGHKEGRSIIFTFKELTAAVLALAAWGQKWKGRQVMGKKLGLVKMSIVQVVGAHLCRDAPLMHLLHCFFLEAQFPVPAAVYIGACDYMGT